MSSKTKIFVIRTKELIYTAIFLALFILLIVLLVQMFTKQPPKTEDYNVFNAPSSAIWADARNGSDPAIRADVYKVSSSAIQMDAQASLGIRRSPLGDTATLPTFGPSGRHERLNCCAKNLL